MSELRTMPAFVALYCDEELIVLLQVLQFGTLLFEI